MLEGRLARVEERTAELIKRWQAALDGPIPGCPKLAIATVPFKFRLKCTPLNLEYSLEHQELAPLGNLHELGCDNPETAIIPPDDKRQRLAGRLVGHFEIAALRFFVGQL